jgi:hypothetical protein
MFDKKAQLIVVVASAAILNTCSTANSAGPAGATSGRQCFNAMSVNGFNAVDDDTVIITTNANTQWKLDIVGACPDIDWSQQIALRTTSGSSFICDSMDAELLVPSRTGTQRCPVGGIQRLTNDQAKALQSTPTK